MGELPVTRVPNREASMSDHDAHNHDHSHEDHSHDWFRHAVGEAAQEDHGSFNARMVFIVLLVTMLMVVTVIVIFAPYTKRAIDKMSVVRQEQNDAGFQEARSAQVSWDAALYGEPVWINKAEGTIQIPYDLAAEQVIKRYSNR